MPTIKRYYTHDNGDRPFIVKVRGKNVEIWKRNKKYEDTTRGFDNDTKGILVAKYTVADVIPGKDVPCARERGEKNCPCRPINGTTILLKLSQNKYVYIGAFVYEFTLMPGDKFEKYYSLLGNNDVPYPVLKCEKYVYMMLDRVAIPCGDFVVCNWPDAYYEFYGYVGSVERMRAKGTAPFRGAQLKGKKMKNLRFIK